ncbi:hypothetical protein M2163_002112 [Streptomyces sp. SAI-135]|nr:hypothetical protein [Streptomyces sp. SAI-135]
MRLMPPSDPRGKLPVSGSIAFPSGVIGPHPVTAVRTGASSAIRTKSTVITNAAMVTLSRLMRRQAMRAGERPVMTVAPLNGSGEGSPTGRVAGIGCCCVVIVRTSRVCAGAGAGFSSSPADRVSSWGCSLGERLRSPAVVGAVRLSGLSQPAERPVKAENDRKGDCLRSLPRVDEGGTFR